MILVVAVRETQRTRNEEVEPTSDDRIGIASLFPSLPVSSCRRPVSISWRSISLRPAGPCMWRALCLSTSDRRRRVGVRCCMGRSDRRCSPALLRPERQRSSTANYFGEVGRLRHGDTSRLRHGPGWRDNHLQRNGSRSRVWRHVTRLPAANGLMSRRSWSLGRGRDAILPHPTCCRACKETTPFRFDPRTHK